MNFISLELPLKSVLYKKYFICQNNVTDCSHICEICHHKIKKMFLNENLYNKLILLIENGL